jgi:hypothetical protein
MAGAWRRVPLSGVAAGVHGADDGAAGLPAGARGRRGLAQGRRWRRCRAWPVPRLAGRGGEALIGRHVVRLAIAPGASNHDCGDELRLAARYADAALSERGWAPSVVSCKLGHSYPAK